jgi:hypothetical protein
MTNDYGRFEMTLRVPNDADKHRCQVARDRLTEVYGKSFVESLVIQQAIQKDRQPDSDATYYRFGGNLDLGRVEGETE